MPRDIIILLSKMASFVGVSKAEFSNDVIKGSTAGDMVVFTASNSQKIMIGASNAPPYATLTSANAGIGTSNPQWPLDVAVAARLSGTGSNTFDTTLSFQRRLAAASPSPEYLVGRGGTIADQNHLIVHAPAQADAGVHVMSSGAISRMFINTFNGNVGFGTANPMFGLTAVGRDIACKTLSVLPDGSYNYHTSNAVPTYGVGYDPTDNRVTVSGWFGVKIKTSGVDALTVDGAGNVASTGGIKTGPCFAIYSLGFGMSSTDTGAHYIYLNGIPSTIFTCMVEVTLVGIAYGDHCDQWSKTYRASYGRNSEGGTMAKLKPDGLFTNYDNPAYREGSNFILHDDTMAYGAAGNINVGVDIVSGNVPRFRVQRSNGLYGNYSFWCSVQITGVLPSTVTYA